MIDSPVSAYITERNALPNLYVEPATRLYAIADLSRIWVYAQVFQDDVGRLKPNDAVEITTDAYPGHKFHGRIESILPQVDLATRTVRVRLEVSNPDLKLKPGMYVNAEFRINLGRQRRPADRYLRQFPDRFRKPTAGCGRFIHAAPARRECGRDSDVQVIIHTAWNGEPPDIIEDQVTYPIVTSLLAAPHIKAVRAQTMFGDSYVYVVFQDGTDLYWARSRVVEYSSSSAPRFLKMFTPQSGRTQLGRDGYTNTPSWTEVIRTVLPICAACRIGTYAMHSKPCPA